VLVLSLLPESPATALEPPGALAPPDEPDGDDSSHPPEAPPPSNVPPPPANASRESPLSREVQSVESLPRLRSLSELARVIKAGACIEASFKRGKGEVGMDEYQVRTWQGWHHHMALSLMAMWFLIGETHRGQQVTPALTLPQVRYGLSLLLPEVFYTPGVDAICRQVQRQLQRNELARFYHHRTRKCIPPRKLHREIQ